MKNLSKYNRISMLNHWDLDGVSGVINVWNALSDYQREDFHFILTGYDSFEKKLKQIGSRPDIDLLIVNDINCSKDQFDLLRNFECDILYIDHHVYEFEPELPKNCKVIINPEWCGAVNMFMYLSKNPTPEWTENKGNIRELNLVTNTYDMWKKTDPMFKAHSMPLNDLFWEYWPEKFFKKFKDGYHCDEEDYEVIARMKQDRQSFLKDAMENHSIANPHANALMVFKPDGKFTNDFTIFYPEYTFYLILKQVDKTSYTYSLRINSENDKLTVHVIYGRMINKLETEFKHGGHTKSGGVVIPTTLNERFVEVFNEVVEELYEEIGAENC